MYNCYAVRRWHKDQISSKKDNNKRSVDQMLREWRNEWTGLICRGQSLIMWSDGSWESGTPPPFPMSANRDKVTRG